MFTVNISEMDKKISDYEKARGKDFAVLLDNINNVKEARTSIFTDEYLNVNCIPPTEMPQEGIVIFKDSLIRVFVLFRIDGSDGNAYFSVYKEGEDGILYQFGFYMSCGNVFCYENADMLLKGTRLYLKDMTMETEEECIQWYKRVLWEYAKT